MENLQEIWQVIYENSGNAGDMGLFFLMSVLVIFIFLFAFAGCIVPIIPGPTLAFLGILFWKLALANDKISYVSIILCALFALLAQLLDWILPVKYTPSKRGAWGAFFGVLVGAIISIMMPPFALIAIFASPLLFAFLFEYSDENSNAKQALKVGIGAFIGTLMSVIAKTAFVLLMILTALVDYIIG